MRVIAQAGEMLDALCWRALGRTADVTEQALDLNPGLAAAGPLLVEGTIVMLPDAAPSAPLRETVNLWD